MEQNDQSHSTPDYFNSGVTEDIQHEIGFYLEIAHEARDIRDGLDNEGQPTHFEIDEKFANRYLIGIKLEEYLGENAGLPAYVPKETLRVLLEAGMIICLEEANEVAQDTLSENDVERGDRLIEFARWSDNDTWKYAGVGFTEWWHMSGDDKWRRLAEHSKQYDEVMGQPNPFRYNLPWAIRDYKDPDMYKNFEPTINISKFLGREEEVTAEGCTVSFRQIVMDALNAIRQKVAAAREIAIEIGDSVVPNQA